MVSDAFSVQDSKDICFTLWYHAYGTAIGSLNIYTADVNLTNRNLVWSVSGQQSLNQQDWKQGVVPISNIQNDYVILIEGTVGSTLNSEGDIR